MIMKQHTAGAIISSIFSLVLAFMSIGFCTKQLIMNIL